MLLQFDLPAKGWQDEYTLLLSLPMKKLQQPATIAEQEMSIPQILLDLELVYLPKEHLVQSIPPKKAGLIQEKQAQQPPPEG